MRRNAITSRRPRYSPATGLIPPTRQTTSSSSAATTAAPSRRANASKIRRASAAFGCSRVGCATMRWTVHGEREVYASPWVTVTLADIEIPGHERFEHHVVRSPRPAAACLVDDPERGVLLLWRHRFITDSWGWEVPAGGVADGESLVEAAAR